ncbi:hypothetical protein BX600DRAFT_516406 [Xylariales sp. PMI_506]|nr:hypothetical protein BX600DRAFT_516406 [Xylariales sp. PMI_506]
MVDRVDIESLLHNGYWPNNKVKPGSFTPAPTSTSSYTYNDDIVPRRSEPFSYGVRRRAYPPAPTVEDEVESVAKEHGSVVSVAPDEEPKHPGDVDQYPILQMLHEHNPERRFVLVSNPSEASAQSSDTEKKPTKIKRAEEKSEESDTKESPPEGKSTYEANTCRKYVLLSPEEEADKRKREQGERAEHPRDRPIRQRRKSRPEDLPTIVTDLNSDGARNDRSRDSRRSKSATGTEPPAEDYFSPRRGTRRPPPGEALLSPDVIKHSTKGRDRAYWDYGGPSSPTSGRIRPGDLASTSQERVSSNSRRNPEPTSKRSTSDAPPNPRRVSKEPYDRVGGDYVETPTTKLSRKSSASRSHQERDSNDSIRQRSASFRGKREPPPTDENRYSSDEDERQRSNEARRRRKSFIHDERDGKLAAPSEARASNGRRSKGASPLPSPRTSQTDIYGDRREKEPFPSPRSNTFPVHQEPRRSESKFSEIDGSPERPPSRSSTARSTISSSVPIAIPVMAAAAAAAAATRSETSADRRSSAMPNPKIRTHDIQSDSHSVSSTHSSPSKPVWQPPKFDPAQNGLRPEPSVTSYRRYSQDVSSRGDLPDLPDCPRTTEQAGHLDWLTLPRCNNFNICPSCYQSAFQNTEFQHLFVPAPFRPIERPIKCDFGASQWYHIAWLLTHTYKKPDLRLFLSLANVSATNQPCTGLNDAYRIWYTIKDPISQRPVRNFNICSHCAKSIEVLLPNLSGAFVPMDTPAEPTRGRCDMHQGTGGERKRFITYWDFMETTSDIALATKSAPDIRELADKIREISLIDECYHSRPVAGRKWYTLRKLPNFTVCEECFTDVIWPEIERDHGGIQAEFYKNPQRIPVAACQLYSTRMRNVFQNAVERNDMQYFESRIRQRWVKEQEYHGKIAGLDPGALGEDWVREEVKRLTKEWKRYE